MDQEPETYSKLNRRKRNQMIFTMTVGPVAIWVLYVLYYLLFTHHPLARIEHITLVIGIFVAVVVGALWFGDHTR